MSSSAVLYPAAAAAAADQHVQPKVDQELLLMFVQTAARL